MKIVSSREVFRSPIFWITQEKAVDPEGFEIERAIIHHSGSAVILPVDEKGRILLIRQFRLPAKSYMYELPAGRLDPGETPLKAAKRELGEETGYRAKKWTKMISFYPSPGFLAEKMTIFVAQDLTAGEKHEMDDERIEMGWYRMKEIDEMVASGKVHDAKTIVGVLMWKNRKKK